METKLYTWKALPAVYKVRAPFTKHFFESGGKVTLVMVVRRPVKDQLDQMLGHYILNATDEYAFGELGNRTRVLFWTVETPRKNKTTGRGTNPKPKTKSKPKKKAAPLPYVPSYGAGGYAFGGPVV